MPNKIELQEKLLLTQSQDTTTALQGSIPVIHVNNSSHGEVLVRAVNFLRNRCEKVQFVFSRELATIDKEEWLETSQQILSELSINESWNFSGLNGSWKFFKFKRSWDFSVSKEGNKEDIGCVLTLTSS